ncbi:MAG: ADP-ribosyltransferase [Prevotellaceae bacterium]|jgi:hypothetical protein|nr:ADP-ribosyltransferase [Prevotellaceae bacterium]
MAGRLGKYDKQHLLNLEKYKRQVENIFNEAVKQAAAMGVNLTDFNPNKPFSFNDYPQIQERLKKLLKSLQGNMQTAIINGVNSEWTLANNKNNALCDRIFGDNNHKLTKEQERRYYSNNDKAREEFLRRKQSGLNLSDRTWNYANQFKTEIEMGLDLGIRDGLSAIEMTRDLRQYLKEPNKLFRRVRDQHGQLRLSQAAKDYHPGQGVYRSSFKNARRLAATETNMAYRSADHERYQQLDFIVGIEIHLSNNHTLNGKPFTDICDHLQGKYPKTFKFTGWHPLCRCFTTSILKDTETFLNDLENDTDTEVKNEVKDVPDNFKEWINDNQERIENAEKRGTLPYFLKDNQNLIEKKKAKVKQEKTDEEKAAIQKRWDDRVRNNTLNDLNSIRNQSNYNYIAIEEAEKIRKSIVFNNENPHSARKKFIELKRQVDESENLKNQITKLEREAANIDIYGLRILDVNKNLNDKISETLFKLDNFNKSTFDDTYNELKNEIEKFKNLKSKIEKAQSENGVIQTGKYSIDRLDNAISFNTINQADNEYRQITGEIWKNLDKETKLELFEYTKGSGKFNRVLRGIERRVDSDGKEIDIFKGIGKVDLSNEGVSKEGWLKLDNVFETAKTKDDLWATRFIDSDGFNKLFNIDIDSFNREQLIDLIGKRSVDEAYTSTSISNDATMFNGKNIKIKLYVPKDSEALYVEPFSYYGGLGEKGSDWNGTTGYVRVSGHMENELLLNRGYETQILSVVKTGTNLRGIEQYEVVMILLDRDRRYFE